jgi:hypothetical protein
MARKFNENKSDFTEFIVINTIKSLSDRMKVSRN